MKFILHDSLKEYIFAFVSEIDIFAYFLRLNPTDIYDCILQPYKKIHNVYRGDKNPSLSFSYNNNKLRAKDWATPNFSGDCFDIVGTIMNENPNSKQGFIKICHYIIDELLDGREDLDVDKVDYRSKLSKKLSKKIPDRFKLISFNLVKQPSKQHRQYWEQIGVPYNKLMDNFVFVASQVWINNRLFYDTTIDTDPCFIYYLGHSKNVPRYKIYRPFAERFNKFRTNYKYSLERIFEIEGGGDILILGKSIKDNLAVKYNLAVLSFPTGGVVVKYINYTSESSRLVPTEASLLENNFNRIIQMTDNDDAGKACAEYHTTNYKFESYFTKAKDFTESILISPKQREDETNNLINFLKG